MYFVEGLQLSIEVFL